MRGRDFRFYAASRLLSGAGQTLLQAAIAWQVYALSGSALQLGLIGLMRFLPALLMSLPAGAVADRYDRRRIVTAAQVVPIACSTVLLATTHSGTITLPLIYGVVFVVALGAAFENPARQALLPQIVPRPIFINAVTVASTIQQLAFVAGPVGAGLLIATLGVDGAYAVHVALLAGAIVTMALVRPRQDEDERRAVSLAAIREGVRFVWHRQVLLGAMTLDMFAVIFGGAIALLPIYAEDILKVGPRGYGLLTSAQGIGALGMSVVMVALPPVQRTGRALLIAVAGYGLATIAFGLSRSFPLSLTAYALTGTADQISVIMRQTTIQLATPDALRGRVSSVSSLFIGASNQVGMVESGIVAALTTTTFAVVSGGAGCLAVVGAVAAGMPELRRYLIGDHPPPGEHARRAAIPHGRPAAAAPARIASSGAAAEGEGGGQ